MYIANKVFMVISNIHFYHLSTGITVDFLVVFDPYLIFYFANIYLGRAVIAACDEYLAYELGD
jgi:hypothetical protein